MKNLRMLRENNNQTQRDCASSLNMPKTTYCYYEQGKISPSIDTLIKIADYFGCSIDYLLGHETKDLIYVNELSPQQTKIIKEVKSLSDEDLYVLEGVILRLKQEKDSPWLRNKP